MADRLNQFTVRECKEIGTALTERVAVLRKEAHACAKTARQWDDPLVKRLMNEAVFVEQLAKHFKFEDDE